MPLILSSLSYKKSIPFLNCSIKSILKRIPNAIGRRFMAFKKKLFKIDFYFRSKHFLKTQNITSEESLSHLLSEIVI